MESAGSVAAAQTAVAQSVRKQAAEQTKHLREQQAENIREAEDETDRQREKRTCAEQTLAAALAERDAETARASGLESENMVLRNRNESLEERLQAAQEENVRLRGEPKTR